jgi:hypothetical protein
VYFLIKIEGAIGSADVCLMGFLKFPLKYGHKKAQKAQKHNFRAINFNELQ